MSNLSAQYKLVTHSSNIPDYTIAKIRMEKFSILAYPKVKIIDMGHFLSYCLYQNYISNISGISPEPNME